MRSSIVSVAVWVGAIGGIGGCIVDDSGGTRGQAPAPTASVPDSGSPVRRESAAETLNEGRPAPARAGDGATLDVEPGRTPPPAR